MKKEPTVSDPKRRTPFRVLSIDGGGIRGVLPAAFLNYIQERIGPTPIHRYFDLITGTSTGGIIALALSVEVPIQEILKLYTTKAGKIFSWRPQKLTKGLLFPMYANKALSLALQGIFTLQTKLGDAKSRLCIPAIDITNGKAIVFKTPHHPDYLNDYRIPVWQVGMATSAAPAYFPAFHAEGIPAFVDGGLWANNPSLVGILEALKLGRQLQEISVLSLGTGNRTMHKQTSTAVKFGLVGWGSEIVDWVFHVQSQAVVNAAKYLCGKNYCRIDIPLPANKSLLSKRFRLDGTNDVGDLRSFGEYKAKETFNQLEHSFFASKVKPYQPLL
jgi:patatin-like phospholipase/acyl hydrolase